MTSVERIKSLCKDRKIPLSRLERDLGFSNGYIGQLRKGTMPAERLSKVAHYLSVSTNYLMTGQEPTNPLLSSDNAILVATVATDNDFMEMAQMYFALSEERREDIRDYVKMKYDKEK